MKLGHKMELEKRKVKYLLKKAKTTMELLDERFAIIDRRIALFESGQLKTVYEPGEFPGEYFPKEIVKIVDREQGIIETYEKSIDKYEKFCIYDYEIEKI